VRSDENETICFLPGPDERDRLGNERRLEMRKIIVAGDRVAVYGPVFTLNWRETRKCDRAKARVLERAGDNLRILLDDAAGLEVWAHPKQCRRLKPSILRRVYIARDELEKCHAKDKEAPAWREPFDHDQFDWVEFVEVRK
jgi:hypothetical protein